MILISNINLNWMIFSNVCALLEYFLLYFFFSRIWQIFLNFSNKVLDISSGIDDVGGLRWELVAYLALAWITVYFVVWKGLHNSGKVMLEIFSLFWLKNVYFFYCLDVAIRVILSIILYGFLFVSISNLRALLGNFGGYFLKP